MWRLFHATDVLEVEGVRGFPTVRRDQGFQSLFILKMAPFKGYILENWWSK